MAATARKGVRRPAGRYAPGDRARGRIIAAAIETFAARGFDGASTRMIARRAKVNLGSIQYYFGGKRELYIACASHIAETVAPQVDALAAMLRQMMPPGHASGHADLAALHRLLGLATERIVGGNKNMSWLMFVSREQLAPGPAFDILYRRVIQRLIGLFAELVGRVIGKPATSEEAILSTFVLMGPLFIFQRAKSVVLHALRWPDLDGERMAQVKAVLARQAIHGLADWR